MPNSYYKRKIEATAFLIELSGEKCRKFLTVWDLRNNKKT